MNFTSGFFESSSNQILPESSHISTVQKGEQNSADKSDFLNNINMQEMKDDSVLANLCDKISS